MAASRMSRILSSWWRLAFLSLVMTITLLASVSAVENLEDVELITASRNADDFVAIAGAADGDSRVSASPSDLKKNSLSKKFQKFYPKTEADWNFKGEGKKTDVYIKDAKDYRLLRIISEGLLNPQDTLPLGPDDAIISSHKNGSNEEMNVNVQPEGMSGIVNDDIAADSDEKMIMEKKKNGTVDTKATKPENDTSTETEENVKINLDASAGVQNPSFNKQRGSITVPAQKHISLSKGKENNAHKKLYDNSGYNSGYDVIPLNKQREKHHTDEGVFDFVDSPLSDKHLVPAGTGQTSRINVKKGPNGQEYEYEYIYYYYEDGDEPTSGKNGGEKVPKGNEISISTSGSTPRTTTPLTRISTTSTPQFTQSFSENANNRVKSTEILTQAVSPSFHSPQVQSHQQSRDKFRTDFRYNVDNSATHSQQIPQGPSKNSAANEVYWQYDSSRFPGRQAQPQTFSEQPFIAPQENIATTKQASRGRFHFNQATTEDASYLVTASPTSTQQPREFTQTRSKSVTGTVRQPGLELVDSNSFRTHSTNVPLDYENAFSPAQTFDTPRGKSIKPSSPQQEFSTIGQTLPSSTLAPKIEIFKKDPTIEYVTATDRFLPQQTTSPRIFSPSATETAIDSNTAPLSTAPENSLTTVYGAGLTDKAAHDLYAIYQQTQNEETIRNTISQDDRTTIVDESAKTFVQTNPPVTSIFTITSPTTTTTTTPAVPVTTTTTTTNPPPPPPPPTTTPAAIPSSPVTGRGRFRGVNRNKFSLSTTETAHSADAANESSEKPRSKFQPTHRREPGHRVSAYGRRGFSSTSTTAPDSDSSSTAASTSSVETSSKPHAFVPSSRTRFRTSTVRTEGINADSQSTSSPGSRPNFADRYNARRRPGLRSSTTAAPEHEEGIVKQDTSSVESSSPADQQSTTFRSIRNRFNNNRPQPLRPGAKLNFSSRGKLGGASSSTSAPVPLDADTSGSVDVPVEQKKEENSEQPASQQQDTINETTVNPSPSTTAANTPHPDPLSRLKHRSKLRVSDRGGHAKINAQQANSTAALNQNRRNLVHNLLPRKRQPSTSTEGQEVPVKEEKPENLPKPVTEESQDEVSQPKSDAEVSESQSTAEASSTTESRLSSLIASRRHNLAGRRPGTLSRSNKQTVTEES